MLVIITAYAPGDDEPLIEDTYKFKTKAIAVQFCEEVNDLAAGMAGLIGQWKECS